jgi:PAS domain S-box-containing protein
MLSIEQKTDNLYKFFFDNSIDLLCVANTNGIFEKLNPEWEKVLGYKLEELEGRPYIDFIHPDDIDSTNKATIELSNNIEVHNYKNRYRHKNGNYIWLEWRSFPKDNKIFAIARNITDQIRKKEILKQNDEINQLIASISTDYVFRLEITKDNKTRFVHISGTFEELTGQKNIDGLQIKSAKEIIHPDHYADWTEFIDHVIKTGSNGEKEYMSSCKHINCWIYLIAKPLMDKQTGQVKSIYVVVKNISERKITELALKKNETIIKATQESINDGMLIVSGNNLVVNYNSRLCEIFSLTKNIFNTKDSNDVFDSIQKQLLHSTGYSERLKKIIYSSESSNDIIKLKNQHIIEQLSYPLKAESPIKGRVWLFRDVTLYKTAEKALRESENNFRNLAESALVGIYLVQNNKFKYVNPCFADIHGYEVEELIDTINPKDLIIPENLNQPALESTIEKTHSNSAYQKIRIVTKYGEVRYAESLGTLTRYNGQPAIIGTLTDITEKIKSERDLLKSQSQLLKSQRIAHLGSWKLDLTTNNLYCDIQTYKIFGLHDYVRPLRLKDFYDAIHPDDRYTIHKFLQEAISSAQLEDFECRIIRTDNEIRVINFGGEIILNNEGKAVQMTGIVQDITELRQGHETKLQNLKFLQNLDKINLAIQSTDDHLTMMKNIARVVCSIFMCDRTIFIQPYHQDSNYWEVPVECANEDYPGVYSTNKPVSIHENMKNIFNDAMSANEPIAFYAGEELDPEEEPWKKYQLKSLLGVAVRTKYGDSWLMGIQQCSHLRRWTSFDKNLFKEISLRISDRLSNLLIKKDLNYNELFLNKIFDNIPFAISVKDAKSLAYLKVNKSIEKIFGYSSKEIIGKQSDFLVPKQKADYITKLDRKAIKNKTIVKGEQKVKNKDNKEVVLQTTKIPVLDESGNAKYLIGISEDVSEQKKIEAQRVFNVTLLESLDRVNRAMQSTNNTELMYKNVLDELLLTFNCERAFLFCPDGSKTLQMASFFENATKGCPDMNELNIQMNNSKTIRLLYERLLDRKAPIELNIDKDFCKEDDLWGKLSIKSLLSTILFPKIGEPWLLIILHCSHTKNWHQQEKLLFQEISARMTDGLSTLLINRIKLDNEEFLNKIFENIPNMILVKDAKTYNLIRINKAGEKLLGYSQKELTGKKHHDIFPKNEADFFFAKDFETIHTKKMVHINEESVTSRHKKKYLLQTKKIPILDNDGNPKYLLSISEDITKTKQAEAEKLFNLKFLKNLDKVNRAIQSSNNVTQVMKNVLQEVLSVFKCDRAFLLYPNDPDTDEWEISMECTVPEYPGAYKTGAKHKINDELKQAFIATLKHRKPYESTFKKEIEQGLDPWHFYSIKSLLVIALFPKTGKPWQFGIHQCSYYRNWTENEKILFTEISRRLTDGLTSAIMYNEKQANEEFLDKIFENIPNMIFIKDAETLSFVKFNKAGEKLIGYSRNELIGKNDYDFFPKKEADFFALKDKEVLKSKKLLDIKEEIIKTSNNETKILHTKKLPILNNNGAPKYLLGISEDITERKKTESALLESEEKFRILADNALIGIFLIQEGQFSYVNQHFADIYGYTTTEIKKVDPFSLIVPEDLGQVMNNYNSVKDINHQQFRIKKKSGEIRLIESRSTSLTIQGKKSYIGTEVDITSRKQAEEALLETKKRLEIFIDSATDAIAIYDNDLRLVEINRKALSYFPKGTKKANLLGLHFGKITPFLKKDDSNYSIYKSIIKTGKPYFHEDEIVVGPNSFFFNVKVFKVDEGIGIVATDITEQKAIESSLRETKELLQSFMDSATDSMTIFNKDLHLIKHNEIALSYFPDSLKGENILGYPLKDLIYKTSKINLYNEAVKVLQSGIPYQSKDILVINSRKKSWFDMKIFKVGDGIGILNSNITPIKVAEEKIMRINTELEERVKQRTYQLEQANKDLESFAYSVSHDLRSPLRHITGFLKHMYSNIDSHNQKIQNYYEKINLASQRMSDMINELLNFSRLGRKTLRIVPIQLEKMLNSIIEQLKPDYAERKIIWKIGDLPKIDGDESLLKIAFENILSNAIKYTSKKEKSTIEIGTKSVKNDYITVFVKDNGAGFDMKYINRLFRVFQRLHSNEEFEGIGIGLANVKQIITKHNGFITAESKLNIGTTFYVNLPKNTDYD